MLGPDLLGDLSSDESACDDYGGAEVGTKPTGSEAPSFGSEACRALEADAREGVDVDLPHQGQCGRR